MKKIICLGLMVALCTTTLLGSTKVTKAKSSTSQEVTDKVNELNSEYDLDISLKNNGNEQQIMSELNNLEEQLNLIKTLKQTTNNQINLVINDTSKNVSTRALDVYSYEWSKRQTVTSDGGTLNYTKHVNFNYTREYTNGYKRFVEIYNVSSDVTSVDDLLMALGLKGWEQDSYSISYSNGSRTATLAIKGHYQLGLNYDFVSVGIKEPFSEETWTLNITLL